MRFILLASLCWACVVFGGLLLAQSPPAASVRVYRMWTKAALVDAAAAHVSRFSEKQAPFIRYVDLSAVPPKHRAKKLQVLSFVFNSLSRSDLIALAQEVPGTEGALAWIDLSLYQIGPAAFDRLGLLGSGPAPFPEPFYHVVTYTVTETILPATTTLVAKKVPTGYANLNRSTGIWEREYRTVVERVVVPGAKTVTKAPVVALSPALNKGTLLGLVTLTKTQFPIYDFRWLCFNALVEPRYHELLGLDDSEASVLELAGANERAADKAGAQVRGAVLFSDVALRNRVLERTPTLAQFGRGTYQKSRDFKTSLALQDVLADVLVDRADAHEIIYNLPNGLLGYFVTDANNKRLDKANEDVAIDSRGRFKNKSVWAAYSCMNCHMPDSGWIELDDEVRALAAKTVTLFASALDAKGKDRGLRIRQKYLTADYNSLLRADQALVRTSVKAATGGLVTGLTPAEVNRELMTTIRDYVDEPIAAAQLALELGYPVAQVSSAVERTPGLDVRFVGLRVGRKQRRDQIEAAFGQLNTVLYLGK